MKRTLVCVLALAALAAGGGCQMMGGTSPDAEFSEAQALWGPGCEDGSCGPGSPMVAEYAAGSECPPGVDCAAAGTCLDGSCRTRLHGALHGMLGRHGKGCMGTCCGKAVGPSTGAVAYPYYTLRGPRDFLLDDPPSIGR
jgi:hypothetical protein